jgi:squalene-hopene/tetraprenyl-beta-curcumene cyclase
LVEAVEAGRHRETAPVGLYFAKLWYYERLYPLTFLVAALGQAVRAETPPAPNAPGKPGG